MNGHPKLLAAILVLAVALLVGGLGYYLIDATHRADRAAKANVALCALRLDLDSRIAQNEQFLALHPNGIPGIPPSLIVQGLTNSQRTRKALSILDCKEAP